MKGKYANLIIIGLLAFSVYSNITKYTYNQKLKEREAEMLEEVERLTIKNARMEQLIQYYASSDYQDIEARRRHNLMLPGEAVFNVVSTGNGSGVKFGSEIEFVDDEPLPESNAQKWWKYFFG